MRSGAQILLGSGSPRRRELLESAGFEVTVCPSGANEDWPDGLDQIHAVKELAQRKMCALGGHRSDLLAITADTVVFLDDLPLNKPVDAADAERMLNAMSNRSHDVVTAFCVRYSSGKTMVDAVSTRVTFRRLSGAEIQRYVATEEPFDKAGAYAIQGRGGSLVDSIAGSYTNVVGLPLAQVISALEFGA